MNGQGDMGRAGNGEEGSSWIFVQGPQAPSYATVPAYTTDVAAICTFK